MKLLSRVVSGLLDVLAPPRCAACDAATVTAFCSACGATSAAASSEPRQLLGVPLIVAGPYAPPLSTAITRFKYEGRAELAHGLAQLLDAPLHALELAPGTAFVPVPLHPRRLATRGYNQAALLAQELAKLRGLSCRSRLLQRTRETAAQVGKERAERLTNTHDAFALRAGQPSVPCAVLVDDVVTTGSTVRACAQALALGGVRLSAVVAVAQALP